VVSKVRPDHAVDDVSAEICNPGSFFTSAKAAGDWLDSHPEGTVAPVREDFDITRQPVIELGWTAG
jgi:alkylmercury lyase